MRFGNRRYTRRAVDVHARCRLRIQGLASPHIWTLFEIPLNGADLPVLVRRRVRLLRRSRRNLTQLLTLRLESLTEHALFNMLSLDAQVKIQSGKGELEDLLQEGLTRELHLIVSAEDGFSCVRRVFVRELESIYETHDDQEVRREVGDGAVVASSPRSLRVLLPAIIWITTWVIRRCRRRAQLTAPRKEPHV